MKQITTIVLMVLGIAIILSFIKNSSASTPKVVHVQAPKKSIEEIIDNSAKAYGLNPLLLKAIIKAESDFDEDAIRFEPHHLKRKDVQKYGKNKSEKRMYASSIGLMQIMAWHAPKYGLTWSELLPTRS